MPLNSQLSMLTGEDDRIFVSIAAYRDPQLTPTILNCLSKASRPERLRFGICWQHGPEELPLPFSGDPRFQVLDVDWQRSRGACWARAQIMNLWKGEEWFLQVDSHCRFAEDWDSRLIATAALTGSAKPVLSTYAAPFTPGANEVLQGDVLQMCLQGFTAEGIPYMKPLAIPNWRRLHRPIRARFLSAGFLFSKGSLVEEVPYDPELYFLGEEAAMTVRAFTHGYDLFHPVENLVWHDYIRAYASKHWDDHKADTRPATNWSELDQRSKARVQRLLSGEPIAHFGLGRLRTIEDYEQYAGLSFRHRKAQDYTMQSFEPPNSDQLPGWEASIYPWMVRVRFERTTLPEDALSDPAFWYVGINDEAGNEIYRKDLTAAELEVFSGPEPMLVIVCEFQSGAIPCTWSVWPVSRSRGWLSRLQGSLAEDDSRILVEEEVEQD